MCPTAQGSLESVVFVTPNMCVPLLRAGPLKKQFSSSLESVVFVTPYIFVPLLRAGLLKKQFSNSLESVVFVTPYMCVLLLRAVWRVLSLLRLICVSHCSGRDHEEAVWQPTLLFAHPHTQAWIEIVYTT